MCGLAGRFHPRHLPRDDVWHREADRLLRHRGPDGSGHFVDEHCELVHRRLALVDLSPTGHQPLTNEDGSIQIIFNGEVYNHRDLRRELLSKGHRFRGTSDTEVLVHLYEEAGAGMVERLRGMFAFAIYDRSNKRLLLARDRFGIKPLFVAELDDQIVFASELKAILALPGFVPQLDRQACFDYLGLGYIPEPATGIANIQMLPKGTTLVVDEAGRRETRFERIRARPQAESMSSIVDRLETQMLRSAEQQSLADVPVAALLSGGIDSSLVVAAYCRARKTKPTTFNVAFPDAAYDETAVARSVAERYETDHHTIRLDDTAMSPDAMFDLLRHFDQPFADTSLFAVHAVSKAIRERGIICTLSGDGGDEAFGGYASFWRANQLVRLAQLPSFARRALAAAGDAAVPLTRDLGRQLAKSVRLAGEMANDTSRLLAGLSNYLDEAQKRELVRGSFRDGLAPIDRVYHAYEPRGTRDLEALSARLTENYFALGLPSDMLRKVDMMSMRASIEVRVPMLDEDLVATGLSLTHENKVAGGTGKLALRALAKRWLPAVVVEHPKRGFGVPLDRMVTPAFHDAASDLLASSTSRTRDLFEPSVVAGWLAMFRAAGDGHAGGTISRGGLYQRIFIILALELFLRERRLTI